MATTTDPAIAELEAKLKSTLLALSHILSFHNSLTQLQATNYAPQAPKKLTRQLRTAAAGFDAVCDQLEHRVLKAMAVLERDARKAAGEPDPVSEDQAADGPAAADSATSDALPISTDALEASSAEPIPTSNADLSALFPALAPLDPAAATSQPLALDGTIPASTGMDLDLSFLNTSAPLDASGAPADAPLDLSFLSDTSLFPADATAATDPPPSLFPPTSAALPDASAAASAPPTTGSAPATADTTAPSTSVPDLSALLAMANNFPTSATAADPTAPTVNAGAAPAPAPAAGADLTGTGAAAPGFEGGMDLFGGLDLSGADGTAPLDFDMTGLDGLDFSNLGDLGDLSMSGDVGAIDFDALLKSMPPA